MNSDLVRPDLVFVALALFGFACCAAAMGILLKRVVMAAWRRFLVRLEDERCAEETAPIFCGRQVR